MSHSFVSFIVSYYSKQEKFLSYCLSSILKQTHREFEIIIVNDGTKDELKTNEEVIAKIIETTPGMLTNTTVYNTPNLYAAGARDYGIRRCDGRFYVPLDADDMIAPTFLEKTIPLLENDSNLGFVYVDTLYVNEDHAPIKKFNQPKYSLPRLLYTGNFLSYCSLFRTSAYNEAGGYNLNNLMYYEDYELYIRLGLKGWYGKKCEDDNALFYYTVHPESSFQSERNRKFSNVYLASIIMNYPVAYTDETISSAKKILEPYPKNFTSLTPKEQEKYL